ncbi:branched-chain amino acid ABC transporter permease [Castellaniella sp.]|uniref:branched-chain amino acid ABC transporter permease n=1 Tax=Castellaniella sp. TaxID=1955812 RepID=UPI0035610A49
MPIELLIATVINGLIAGTMYAIFAGGLTLIWGTMKMLNFAHGAFFMVGGYVLYMLYQANHLNPVLAIAVALLVVYLISLLVERAVIRPLLNKATWPLTTIIATLGVMIFLQNGALNIWGADYKSLDYFVDGIVRVMGVRVSYQRLLIFLVSIVTLGVMWYLLKYTRFGMALRATAQDPDAAKLYGINVLRVYSQTYALSAVLGGIAAVMMAPIVSVNPLMGVGPLLKGFVVVILGGLGSFAGAIVGGLLLGVLEAIGSLYTSAEWGDVISYAILIFIIWAKPWGLLGIEERN